MEMVQGQTLTNYAEEKKLGTRARLELLAKIADAIQHAHQKGVIHRDLKPGNILVTDDGQVKVLDFGVARATDADIQTTTMRTDIGQLVGTIPYMSPEQAAGDPDELDTRSDVYALGVVAYELLAGRLPYDIAKKMVHEAVRVIREDDPTPLSSIDRVFRGDIEIIIATALQKEKERRYQSASDFASDIHRYLKSEPIVARTPSTWYQLSRFSRRNKALVGGVIAVLVVSVVGTAVSISFAMGEAEQKELAIESAKDARDALVLANQREQEALAAKAEENLRAEELQLVTDFQAEQIGAIEPMNMGIRLRRSLIDAVPLDRRDTVEQSLSGINFTDIALETLEDNIFEHTLEAIDEKFTNKPIVQAQLLQSMAHTLKVIGLVDLAIEPQKRVIEIRRQELGNASSDTLSSIDAMGNLLVMRGNLIDAESHIREALYGRQATLGKDHPDTLESIFNMADLFRTIGELPKAESYYRESMDGFRRVLGNDHPNTLASINGMGQILEAQSKLEDAMPYFQEALEGRRRVLGDDHPETLNSINNMGTLHIFQGRPSKAEPYCREALEGSRRVLGNTHLYTLILIDNMGTVLMRQGKIFEAEPFVREALEGHRYVLGNDHRDTLLSINNMGYLLLLQDNLAEAEPYLREAVEGGRRVRGDDHPDTLQSVNTMAYLLDLQSRWSESEELRRLQLDTARRAEPEDGENLGSALFQLGDNLLKQSRLVAAEQVLIECLEIRRSVSPEGHWLIWNTCSLLGETIAAQLRFEDAEIFLVEAAEHIELPEQLSGQLEEAIRRVVELYTAWHAAEPEAGHDAKRAQWQAKLDAIQNDSEDGG